MNLCEIQPNLTQVETWQYWYFMKSGILVLEKNYENGTYSKNFAYHILKKKVNCYLLTVNPFVSPYFIKDHMTYYSWLC